MEWRELLNSLRLRRDAAGWLEDKLFRNDNGLLFSAQYTESDADAYAQSLREQLIQSAEHIDKGCERLRTMCDYRALDVQLDFELSEMEGYAFWLKQNYKPEPAAQMQSSPEAHSRFMERFLQGVA